MALSAGGGVQGRKKSGGSEGEEKQKVLLLHLILEQKRTTCRGPCLCLFPAQLLTIDWQEMQDDISHSPEEAKPFLPKIQATPLLRQHHIL